MWEELFLKEKTINLTSDAEREKVSDFLHLQGLTPDKDIEYTMTVTDKENRVVATGSFSGRVLKCIAVDDEYKGAGLSAKVVTHLLGEQYRRGRTHLFVYTKPENRNIFSELGFYALAEVPEKVVLMENKPDGIRRYLDKLALESGEVIPSAAVVVNCNPFTKGHRHLIEYASAGCRLLHVFVVWEDKSVFPSEVRYKLVAEGIRDLPDVVIHKGEDYIISGATFPSYFLKESEEVAEIQARLDLELFSKHIAKKLGIKKRFVGEEPFSPVTAAYNRIMKEVLPLNGIEVEEIPRISTNGGGLGKSIGESGMTTGESGKNAGEIISASRVRELLGQRDFLSVRELVPETTYKFLVSAEAEEIIQKIKHSLGR